jgi:hypothetical protein
MLYCTATPAERLVLTNRQKRFRLDTVIKAGAKSGFIDTQLVANVCTCIHVYGSYCRHYDPSITIAANVQPCIHVGPVRYLWFRWDSNNDCQVAYQTISIHSCLAKPVRPTDAP